MNISRSPFSRLSARNCARIYNYALAKPNAHILNNPLAYGISPSNDESVVDWPYSLELQSEEAMNGFFLYSLMLHMAEHNTHLVLSHSSTQNDRLSEALSYRNKVMEGTGQEEWTHACDQCFVVHQGENGQFGEILHYLHG